MAYVSNIDAASECSVCRRRLLLGEEATRFSTGNSEWVSVCALCRDAASESGWVKEGAPVAPVVAERRGRLRRVPGRSTRSEPMPGRLEAVPDPDPGHGGYEQHALIAATELFNESAFRRTVAGIGKSLGAPQVSLMHLSGTHPEVVITVAWEISWYQYRVAFDSGQPIRLAERGYELHGLDARFTRWNASLDPDMRINVLPSPAGAADPAGPDRLEAADG